jgi:purine-binding chemotaxis protein CheW
MSDAELLRLRAQALARRPAERAASAEDGIELLVFTLGNEEYGLPLGAVREVFRPRELAVLPGAEPPCYAVTPWRGLLLNTLDLRATLGVAGRGIMDLSHVVVVGLEQRSVGVLVDRLGGTRSVAEHELLAPKRDSAADNSGADKGLVHAMTRDAVLVLDAAVLLRNYG